MNAKLIPEPAWSYTHSVFWTTQKSQLRIIIHTRLQKAVCLSTHKCRTFPIVVCIETFLVRAGFKVAENWIVELLSETVLFVLCIIGCFCDSWRLSQNIIFRCLPHLWIDLIGWTFTIDNVVYQMSHRTFRGRQRLSQSVIFHFLLHCRDYAGFHISSHYIHPRGLEKCGKVNKYLNVKQCSATNNHYRCMRGDVLQSNWKAKLVLEETVMHHYWASLLHGCESFLDTLLLCSTILV